MMARAHRAARERGIDRDTGPRDRREARLSRSAGAGLSIRRCVFLIAALFCLSWQSVVAPAHIHGIAAAAATSAVAGSAGAPEPGKRAPAHLPDSCQICRELAHAAHYLPPPPVVLVAPYRETIFTTAQAPRQAIVRPASHAWRSRAPPIELHA